MKACELIKNLEPMFYTFDEEKSLFKKIVNKAINSPYEFTAEFIKIFRELKENNIKFLEDKDGNLKIYA